MKSLKKILLKICVHYFEFIIFILLRIILKLIGFKNSSSLGGYIFKKIDKHTKYFKIIKKNMKLIIKDKILLNNSAIKNLEQTGKTFFEFLLLSNRINHVSSIINLKYLYKIKKNYKSCIFVSAHYGNWEITRNFLVNNGLILHTVYRHANNSFINKEIQKIRELPGAFFYKKGKESAKHMIKALKNNEHIAILVDQKDTSGKRINFFDKEALTNTGFASLAIKYKATICPIVSSRELNGTFKIIIEKPIEFEDIKIKCDRHLTEMVYKNYIEKWIKKDPSQWLWAHKRW